MCASRRKSVPTKKKMSSPKSSKQPVRKSVPTRTPSPTKPVLGEADHPALRGMKFTKKSVRLTFSSETDLHLQALALANHLEEVQAPLPLAGTTYLGYPAAVEIVCACAESDDLTLTVQDCGKSGAGIQQCIEGALRADGYDPAPLHLNIQDKDYLNTIANQIAVASK